MSYSLVGSSVVAGDSVATYNYKSSHKKNETSSQATNIGNLTQQNTTIKISDGGLAAANGASRSFSTATAGSLTLKKELSFIDKERFQLLDNTGNVLADSEGDAEQIKAYNQWVAGTLFVGKGTYTAVVTPDASNARYGIGTINIEDPSSQTGTSLAVTSQLTGSDQTEFYNYSFSGTNMKLDFNTTSHSGSARVVIANSNGHIIADSAGNAFQRSNYLALTSNRGLAASSGDYTVKVGYPAGGDPKTQNINYDFQLYSGTSYSVVYKNKVAAQPTDNSAAGSVTATRDALLFTGTRFHKINAKISDAINLGWMKQDKSALVALSQLTSIDNVEYYSFTLEEGHNLKFDFNKNATKNPSALRVQVLDRTGSRVIADSEGTDVQKRIYQQLRSSDGVETKTGTYLIKISYAAKAHKADTAYQFSLFSGTKYSAQYKTTAPAEKFSTAVLRGGITGTSTAMVMANYLNAQSKDDPPDFLTDALRTLV